MLHRVVSRIISGGQSGADRAALDAAIGCGVDYGGWCPLGGWAEDHPEPPGLLAKYPQLRESTSAEPEERTRLNVRDSDATLIITSGTSSEGTDLTGQHARNLGRPMFICRDSDVDAVVRWLSGLQPGLTLNVAGPRESEQPGIYREALALMREVLKS